MTKNGRVRKLRGAELMIIARARKQEAGSRNVLARRQAQHVVAHARGHALLAHDLDLALRRGGELAQPARRQARATRDEKQEVAPLLLGHVEHFLQQQGVTGGRGERGRNGERGGRGVE